MIMKSIQEAKMALALAVAKVKIAFWILFYDKHYDYESVFVFLEYKLNSLNKFLGNSKYVEHDRKTLQSLRIASKLASRLKKDEYALNASNRMEAKWGKRTHILQGNFYTIGWEKAKTTLELNKAKQDFSRLCRLAWQIEERDYKNFFAILTKYLRLYWD